MIVLNRWRSDITSDDDEEADHLPNRVVPRFVSRDISQSSSVIIDLSSRSFRFLHFIRQTLCHGSRITMVT